MTRRDYVDLDDLTELATDPRTPPHVVREAMRAAAIYATLAAAANAASLGVTA